MLRGRQDKDTGQRPTCPWWLSQTRQGRVLESLQPSVGGFLPSLGPRTCMHMEGGRAHACPVEGPACSLCPGFSAPPSSPAGWSRARTRTRMSLWAVPILVGDVMPGAGKGPLEALTSEAWHQSPGPGLPAKWSQRGIASVQQRRRKACLAPGQRCAGSEEGPSPQAAGPCPQ